MRACDDVGANLALAQGVGKDGRELPDSGLCAAIVAAPNVQDLRIKAQSAYQVNPR